MEIYFLAGYLRVVTEEKLLAVSHWLLAKSQQPMAIFKPTT